MCMHVNMRVCTDTFKNKHDTWITRILFFIFWRLKYNCFLSFKCLQIFLKIVFSELHIFNLIIFFNGLIHLFNITLKLTSNRFHYGQGKLAFLPSCGEGSSARVSVKPSEPVQDKTKADLERDNEHALYQGFSVKCVLAVLASSNFSQWCVDKNTFTLLGSNPNSLNRPGCTSIKTKTER